MHGVPHHAQAPRPNGGSTLTAATNSTTLQLGFGFRDQTAHLPVYLQVRTTNLPGPDSTCGAQAQQRRMDRAAGKYERKRFRKQLAQQSASQYHDLLVLFTREKHLRSLLFGSQLATRSSARLLLWYVLTHPASASET